jgi:ApaG protein
MDPPRRSIRAAAGPFNGAALAPANRARQVLGVQPSIAEPVSNAITQGIRVTVRSNYLPDQSSPEDDRYVFAYTVAIVNEGVGPAQLRTRHWVITDGKGKIEEVRGDGVVGEQPRLSPGQTFQYTSGCVLKTPIGSMHGSYQMFRDDGSSFDAVIAPFSLASPAHGRSRPLN